LLFEADDADLRPQGKQSTKKGPPDMGQPFICGL